MSPENQRYELTDAELERVSGGWIPNESDPAAISHYSIVYLLWCASCDWHGLAFAVNEIPFICPDCGVTGEVYVHNTDTITDDYDLSVLSSWWLR